MNFDEIIERRGTGCGKWDKMEPLFGVSPNDGIPMWVADMDFRSPDCVVQAAQRLTDHGVFGYQGDYSAYFDAIRWWMRTRHGWEVKEEEIFTTYGLVNAVGLAMAAFTQPGDEIVLFAPVYYVFARTIRNAGRKVKELPLVINPDTGMFDMDFDAYDARMTGAEKMMIFCSPHNPGGRIWTAEEQRALAEFAKRHDLLVVSDEIHHDLILPGYTHTPFAVAAPEASDRTLMLTAPSKTFNVAGNHAGQVIIQDPVLRETFGALLAGLGMSPSIYGTAMTAAAYSAEGADWVDELMVYLEENIRIFTEAVDAIPGVSVMPMQATYLVWVNFAGTGMDYAEVLKRVNQDARLAPQEGPAFGTGGETCLRFNVATQRSRVIEAADRLKQAFGDLQ